jgi:hypothetical protein
LKNNYDKGLDKSPQIWYNKYNKRDTKGIDTMSYGIYSEVYFAINIMTENLIKIGETTNARRRACQLFKDNYYIVISKNVKGDKAARLFVENYLRERIEATGKAIRFRRDYFECKNKEIAHWLFGQFEDWVAEAHQLLEPLQGD